MKGGKMDFKNIILEKKDNICKVIFDRPKALNALNTEVLKELNRLCQKEGYYQESACALKQSLLEN